MKLLEITNPSDPYTISGENELLACVACLLLGQLRELSQESKNVAVTRKNNPTIGKET